MADGSLNFDTKIITDGFNLGVKKIGDGLGGLKGKLTALSKAIGAVFGVNWFASAIKGITEFSAEFRGIAEQFQPFVEAAAEVNAENSQMEQTFGSLLNVAEDGIRRVAEASGIVQTRLNGTAASIYAFARTADMDAVTALNMMEEALQVAADSAAYYDRSLEETSETLKSFLKGNFANDAALGLSATEFTRNAAANKLYGKSYIELSEAQKQLTLLQMVKDANALSGAEGQAAREAEGWENVTGNLREAWRQLLAVVGQPVLTIAVSGVQRMTAAIEMLTKWANAAVDAMSKLFGWESEQSAAVSKNIADSVDNQNALTEAVSETEKAQKGSLAAFDQLNILTSKNDDDTDDTGNSENVVIVPTVSENVVEKAADDLKKRLENLLEPIKVAWEDESPTIIENAKRAVNAIKSLILSIGESIEEVFTNGSGEQLVRNILKIFGNLLGIIGDIAIALETAWNSGGTGTALVQSYVDLWTELTGIVNDFIEDLRAAWNDGAGVELMGKILKIVTNINRFASNLIERFREAWNENELGRKIISGIFALFNRVADMIVYCAEAAAEWAANVDFAPLLEAIYNFVEALLPYWDILCKGVETLFTKVLLPCLKYLIENLLPAMFNFLTWSVNAVVSLPDKIVGIWKAFENFGEWLYDKFSEVGNGIIEIFSGIGDWFGEKWESVKEIFSLVAEWFTEKFTDAYNGVTGIFSPISGWFGDRWENIKEKFEIVGAWFRECFAVAVNYIKEVFTPIVNFFGNIWEKIKTIFAKVASWFGEKFKAAWDKIMAIFDKAKEYFSAVWGIIKGVFAVVVVWFEDKFRQAWDKITAVFNGAKAYFSAVWEGIKMIFSRVTDWFRDKFTEAWEAVKYVFSNGGAIFDGIVDGIFNVFRDIVNGLIFGINCVIWEPFNAINSALDGIRGVEIMGFAPFEWLPYINIPQIPYLAQGTVVPANYGNFLAVLGDNKREAEVVSPISSIEKAVENVLARHGMPNELTINTYLFPNSAAFHREVIKIVNEDNRRKGQ